MTHSSPPASRIYVDLDDCLIHTIVGRAGSNKRKKLPIQTDDAYFSILSPMAGDLLKLCRSLRPTSLLTTATGDYARAANEIFELGFICREIIARADFMVEAEDSPLSAKHFATDPAGLLIDNQKLGDQAAMIKRKFLGIPDANYFQIREFCGHPKESFDKELARLGGWLVGRV